MINNVHRVGNLTSSEIVALTKLAKDGKSFGVPAMTYIDEANMERRLGRSLTDEVTAKPLTWGKLVEARAFDSLGLEYSILSTDTIVHPTIKFWSGSPDGIKNSKEGRTVIDIKCPLTLKSFCQLVDPLYNGLDGIEAMTAIRDNHKDGDKYYWQLVSNAILTDSKFAELIVYVPYLSEIEEIKMMAQDVPAELLSRHYWIAMAMDGELPFLKDEGYYKNLNIIRFQVSQHDKDFLTDKVLEAGKLLINNPSAILATHNPELKTTIVEEIKLHKI